MWLGTTLNGFLTLGASFHYRRSAYQGSLHLSCRGVVYEALARYDEAAQDYQAVLKAAPNDPSGWNNLVNY